MENQNIQENKILALISNLLWPSGLFRNYIQNF